MSVPQYPGLGQNVHQAPLYGGPAHKNESTIVDPVKYERWTITADVLGGHLQKMNRQNVGELAKQICDANKDKEGKNSLTLKKLCNDLKKHGLPIDNKNAKSGDRKVETVANVIRQLQTEANKGGSRILGGNFCDLIKNADSSIADGLQLLLDDINKKTFEGPRGTGLPQVGGDGAVPGGYDLKEFSSAFTCGEGRKPSEIPAEAQAASPNAPPAYDSSQGQMLTQLLLAFKDRIAKLADGYPEAFPDEIDYIKGTLSNMDIDPGQKSLIANTPVINDAFMEVRKQFTDFQLIRFEKGLASQYRERIDGLEAKLSGLGNAEEKTKELNVIHLDLKGLVANGIDKLSSIETIKKELNGKARDLGVYVSAHKSIGDMEEYLSEFDVEKTPKMVSDFSGRLDVVNKEINNLSVGKIRRELKEALVKIKEEFNPIKDKVNKKRIDDVFEKVGKELVMLEQGKGENIDFNTYKDVKSELEIIKKLVTEQGNTENSKRYVSLWDRLSVFEKKAEAGQSSASTMQPSDHGLETLIKKANELIEDIDMRLCGAEKTQNEVPGSVLNPTHIGEVKALLDQLYQQPMKIKGEEHRSERDRLQTMYANLFKRMKVLQSQATNSGQATASKTSAGDRQVVVDIRAALNEAESSINALKSNPNSNSKDDLCSEAKSKLEKATQMLSKLTDPTSKPERSALNTILSGLSGRLQKLETGTNKGQLTSISNISEPQPQDVLKRTTDEVRRQLVGFDITDQSFRQTMGDLSQRFASLSTEFNVSGGTPAQNLAKQREYRPSVPAISLMQQASELKQCATRANIHSDNYLKASIGVDLSNKSLQPVILNRNINFKTLSLELKNKMSAAFPNVNLVNINLIEVFLFASQIKDFNNASMKMTLESDIDEGYLTECLNRGLSPVEVDLSLSRKLQGGNGFCSSSWSVASSNHPPAFAFSSDGQNKRQDIALIDMQRILMAAGTQEKIATSNMVGSLIPFKVGLRCQSSVQPKGQDEIDGFDDDIEIDGVDSAALQIGLNNETTYEESKLRSANEQRGLNVGLLSIRLAVGVNEEGTLKQWMVARRLTDDDINGINI